MQTTSIRQYERLAEAQRTSRRTMADAIAVLQDMAGFADTDLAQILVGQIKLPSAEVLGLVQIVFDRPVNHGPYVVSLPTCKQLRAKRPGESEHDFFDIATLHDATLDTAGNALLADGMTLRNIEVIPAWLPIEPSRLDWRIVHHTLSILRAEGCYRDLRHGIPLELREMVPDWKILDCSRFSGLSLPPLKVLASCIRDLDPTLKKLSQQQIADTLQKFGIRIPTARPRRPLATIQLG
jgi:hypothetical protein